MSGSKIVFVGNIPYEQTEEQLIEIFSEVGPVVSFRLLFDRETGKPRGYGFCEYKDERTAASAVRNLNGREIGVRTLKVDYADTDQARMHSREMDDSRGQNHQAPRLHGVQQQPPPPPPPMFPPHLPHMQHAPGAFMPPPQALPRMDPRLAAGNQPPPVPLIPPPSQPPQAPVPVPSNPADPITAVLGTMTPQNMFDLISSMKVLGTNEPEKARAVLNANPQLSYALFQALLLMNLVDPSSLQQQQQLVAQVLALTPADIASLPEEHRPNILQLRAQLLGGNAP
ncbi:Cleavage stimulation factor subunit 2 [Podila epigama]|nr:Cleavage stimulation factor subunit 2 [Podila epigama]